MATDIESYKKEMMVFWEEFDELVTGQAKLKRSSSTDLDRALLGLWRIITYNMFVVIEGFLDKKKFYAVAGCTRVMLECVADASHLIGHPDEAEKYWKNQEAIKAHLNTNEDRWQAFIDGDLNKYGQLSDKTQSRIKNTLGTEAIGQYNWLCFYAHPNTASMFWLLGDSEGHLVKFTLQIMTQMLGEFIELLDNSSVFEIDSKLWTIKLDKIFKLLGGSAPELKV